MEKTMPPSLDDIALFVEVARRKNFSRAAEAMNMPVSTLSRRISELERRLEVRLLNRSTRKIELTEAGRERLAHERSIGNAWLERAIADQLTDDERQLLGAAIPLLRKLTGGAAVE